MKIFKITFIIIILCTLVNAVRQEYHFPILQSLPLLGGIKPLKYEVAGIVVVCITVWFCHRIRKRRKRVDHSRYSSGNILHSGHSYHPINPYYRNYRY